MTRMKRVRTYLLTFFFVFSFVIVALLWCWMDEKTILNIYLPKGNWNDEVFYYKQIGAMVKYGIPQGYFGYNEMSARYLTFGPWSIVLLMPYYIWGKVFGWNVLSPILANLTMITISMGVFFYIVRPKVKQMFFWCLLVLAMPIITRFVISGMVETIFYSAVIILVALQLSLHRVQDKRVIISCYIIVGVISLARPYFLLFILIPYYFARNINKKKANIFTVFWGGLIVFVYYIVNTYLCAPYVVPIINTDFLKVFKERGCIELILFMLIKYYHGIKDILTYMAGAIKVGGNGELYILFAIVFIFALCIYWMKRQKRVLFIGISYFLILSAILLLYSVDTGCRHLLAFIIYGLLIMIMEIDVKGICVLEALIWGACIIIPKDPYLYDIPYKDRAVVQECEGINKELEQIMKLEKGIGWDNTVAWIYDEQYDICYYIPDGFGINICLEEIDSASLKSKYILINRDNLLWERYKSLYKLIWEGDNYVLLCR